jgi:hypothetical protein
MLMKISQTLRTIVLGITGLSLLLAAVPVAKVHAAFGPDFQAGNIIADSLFFDGSAMNADQIQAFLNSRVPSCDTNGTQTSEYGGGTRAQYGIARGYAPPYICLKNYIENPNTLANNLGGTAPAGGWSAAQIIANASVTYGVSPKVLLDMIQKESGLVTDTWPFPSQYRTATGYGCPDSAPCDAQYYGFFNQVTNAARQLRSYANNPQNYRYKAGQTNSILYSPAAGCGAGNVFIRNQATADLYNYTPYQPNAAALNNLYGNGDACSSYGNRNFWRNYSDWFGSTSGSDLARSVNNATVYLLSGPNKYPIADWSTLNDYGVLGGITFVSDDYLNAHTTGPLLTHMVGGSDGTLYFLDAGMKLPFTTCDQVAAYGYSCGSINYLTDAQLSAFATGPAMTSLYGTTNGKRFYVSNGQKHEVFDAASLTQAGITDGTNVLLEAGLAYLPYGTPVIRSNVMVANRSDGQHYLYSQGTYYRLPGIQAGYAYMQSLPGGSLDGSSLATGQVSSSFNGFITGATTGNTYILLPRGKIQLTAPSAWGVQTTLIDDTLITALPTATDPINNGLVMTPGDGTVYYVIGGKKRPVPSWVDLVNLQAQPFAINTIDASELNAIPTGRIIYAPGTMVKTSDSATIYIVKSDTELLPITSFLFPQELGTPPVFEIMRTADLGNYTVDGAVQTKISCGGQDYVGIGGRIYPMDAAALAQFGFVQADFVDAGSLCSVLPKSTQSPPSFLLDSNGTIYLVQSGAKHAFTGYGAYLAHGGSPQNTIRVSDYTAGLIPNGSNISQ